MSRNQPNDLNWYAACVHPRREIDTAHALTAAGFMAYVPCETMERVIMGRKRRFRRPAVPGYLFAQIHPDQLCEIRAQEAVYGFVATTLPDGSRTPARINPAELRNIILAEMFGDLDFTRRPGDWKPAKGDVVRVKSGLFRQYIGTILSLSSKEAWIEPTKGGKMVVKLADLERAA